MELIWMMVGIGVLSSVLMVFEKNSSPSYVKEVATRERRSTRKVDD